MTQTENLLKWLPTEMGGLDAGPIERVEHEYAPWEKRCHALANVLDIHKIVSTEEKRRGVESLGGKVDGELTYYERWIVAFANILFQKGIFSPEDLARKMNEVEQRSQEEESRGVTAS
jgi:Nitrile hydratase beta subunit